MTTALSEVAVAVSYMIIGAFAWGLFSRARRVIPDLWRIWRKHESS